MSLSQPDPASPASVADASFGTTRRGFDQGQVRDFLRMVAAELGRMQERERFLERELRTAQSSPDLDAASLDDAALTRLLGEETARVLSTARESAREIREKAEESAARMLSEASDEVARIREQADLDTARMRADAAADAESEIEMAKQQGREMVTEARAYRERVLSELARRRELAREQIEQLVHGRDRLIQAFERARLAAVDVVGELEPIGEPNEYVNLTPTTGPVPVMVPNARPEPEPTAALPRTLDPAEHDGEAESDPDAGAHESAGAADEAVALYDVDHEDGTDAGTSEPAEAPDDDAGPTASGDGIDADVDTAADEAEGVEAEGGVDVVGIGHSDADISVATDEPSGEIDDDPGATADDADVVAEPSVDEDESTSAEADESDEPAADEADERSALDDADAPVGDDGATEERDDVVVDLFARLRAGSAHDETGIDADADADVEHGESDSTDDDIGDDGVAATVIGDTLAGADATDTTEDGEPEDLDETPFRARDAALTPLIVASARKLKRVLADEQNGVLEVLRGDVGVTALDELVPASDEQIARYVEAIDADLAEAADAGARSVAGEDAGLDHDATSAARTAAAEIVADWLVTPLRDRLERCVDEGDGDNVAISRRVRSVYREWKTQHIDEQLDDVLRTSYGRGAVGAVDGSAELLWLVDSDHPTCPDCDDNSLSPPVTAGDPFPTGHTFAPAHPGCRCLVEVADR